MRDYIFTKYLEIDDLLEKEEYIKEQSIEDYKCAKIKDNPGKIITTRRCLICRYK